MRQVFFSFRKANNFSRFLLYSLNLHAEFSNYTPEKKRKKRPRTAALTMRITSHCAIPENVTSLLILIFNSQLKAVCDQAERRNPSL